jgi:putative addiction module CopG family antidote
MTLSLPADLQGFVEDKVATGAYSNDAEVIRAAVARMKESESDYERQLEWLRDAIEEGWRDARAGNLMSAEDFEVEFAEFERQWVEERSASHTS